MRPEDEALFFSHDLATPLTNVGGAHYLLKTMLKGGDAGVEEALEILDANTHYIERMLGWYWRLRELEGRSQPAQPWPLSSLFSSLRTRIAEEGLPLAPPEEIRCGASLQIPQEALEVGLLGAAISLSSASERDVHWRFEVLEGVLSSRFEVEGDQDLLDPGRLFRKVYWPSRRKVCAWIDPCLPYLKAAIGPCGGDLELLWEEDRWRLMVSIPLAP